MTTFTHGHSPHYLGGELRMSCGRSCVHMREMSCLTVALQSVVHVHLAIVQLGLPEHVFCALSPCHHAARDSCGVRSWTK